MPVRPPALDDRGFDDLVADLVRRIPAHTPEWTNPRVGDPGRTLIDLFAWLGDTILYRANLVPERQRLAFLRLLGGGLRPAVPATGLLQLALAEPNAIVPAQVPAGAAIDKPVPFATMQEVSVHALEGMCVIKRIPTAAEDRQLRDVLPDLRELYGLSGTPRGYVTTEVFPAGAAEPGGRDIAAEARDGCLWIALLAATPDPALVAAVRAELGGGAQGRRRVLNVGLAPALPMPEGFDDVGIRARVPHAWEICTGADDGEEHRPLEILTDGTAGLTRAGVVRLLLPGADDIGAPDNDVLRQVRAGVGDRPPRLDDPALAARLVTWVRLRPDPRAQLASLRLAWAGINAVSIQQLRAFGRQAVGHGTGASGLELSLGATSVEAASLSVEVEEEEGMRPWRLVADVATAGRGARVFSLDAEAGTIRFGDGVRGMAPGLGRAVHVAFMRAGGGAAGNLAAGSIRALALPGGPRLKVSQPLPTQGGADAESLAEAEVRIPASLRHGGRAVTASDYRELALRTPGVVLGRVEVIERFKPQQRREGVPGVVSVMVVPARASPLEPAPRPDRPTLETVHAWLDERRPLATELYVIGTDYVPVGVSAAVELVDQGRREEVLDAVTRAIRLHLWSLPPGGPDGQGWPLGRAVDDRLIETAIGRVPGVRAVAPVRLFTRRPGQRRWSAVAEDATGRGRIRLERWQMPELLMLDVSEGDSAAARLPASPTVGDAAIAVPVVPRVC